MSRFFKLSAAAAVFWALGVMVFTEFSEADSYIRQLVLASGWLAILFLYLLVGFAPPVKRPMRECLLHLRSISHPTLMAWSGPQEAYLHFFSPLTEEFERIIGSAVRHPSGTIYAAACPARHGHVIALMDEYGDAGGRQTRDQGFLTNHGRYVDREEGLQVAQRAQQVLVKTGPQHELFSEDVWMGPLVAPVELRKKAQELVELARSCSCVVTIETTPAKPLAMGHYDMTVDVRRTLEVIRSQAAEARRLAELSEQAIAQAENRNEVQPAKEAA